jgi:CheY-like chemotaxis protein
MRLRITRNLTGNVDGIDLSRFIKDLTYEVSTSLANLLLAERWAEPVSAKKSDSERVVASHVHQPGVLIVEDDDDSRTILAETLRFHGYAVVEACDGREGLSALAHHRPAVILLDLRMPRMSGREFRNAQQQLEDSELARVPIIVVSAVEDAHEQGRMLGAAEVIQKPVDLPHLLDVVQHRIRQRVVLG